MKYWVIGSNHKCRSMFVANYDTLDQAMNYINQSAGQNLEFTLLKGVKLDLIPVQTITVYEAEDSDEI